MVIAGHVVVHRLTRRADAEDNKKSNNERIIALVLETVNWFDMDKQIFFGSIRAKKEIHVPPIRTGHPVHSLVAAIRNTRPDLDQQATSLITSSRKYFDITRIFIPDAELGEHEKHFDEMENLSNGIMVTLTTIQEAARIDRMKK